MAEQQSLRLILPLEQLPAFYQLLQQGVWLRAQTGCSVASLLTEQFGIAEGYIVKRITTLFLDYKPIDDLETARVNNGSTLALSSAMPGLVGTTMRRGSHLAAMRGDISCQAQQKIESGTGRIKIKLFNMIMTEQGGKILSHGIFLSNHDLGIFLNAQEGSFWQSFGAINLGGQQIDPSRLKNYVSSADPTGEIHVKVDFKD